MSARRARPDTTRRAPAILVVGLVVAAVVAAGVSIDGRDGTVDHATGPLPAELSEVAPSPDALGSTWYCAAGTADAVGAADHRVVIANFGAQPVDVVLTVVPGADTGSDPTASVTTEDITVDARSQSTIRLGDLVETGYAAAIVEAGPGEVAVEHTVTSSTVFDAAPCESSSSSTWYFAAGVTTRDAAEKLFLFNPFPDDTVVDISFTTPEGNRAPEAFSGLIVPGRQVTAVDVGAVVSRHPNVATSVVARSGRLVVERLQRFDGTNGPAGLALTPGAPAPALVWHLPDGLVDAGISEIVTVYNPTDEPAEVDVEVDLDPSDDPAAAQAVAPYELSIAPQAYAQVDLGGSADYDPVPDKRGHSVTVRSQNGVPVVAERWIRSGSPAPRTGLAATLAAPVVATRWLSAAGSATAEMAAFLVLVNPSADGIARVTISAASPTQTLALAGLEDVEVPAQGRVLIDVGQYVQRPDLLLTVDSTLPIVVERGLYPTAGGITESILVPSRPAASVPDVDTGTVPI